MNMIVDRGPDGMQALEEMMLSAQQNFTRFILKRNELSGHCGETEIPQILYLYLNDYIGNSWREIVRTMAVTRVSSVLATYYGYASASYADMIRDYVYGDTRETFFSPLVWYRNKNSREMIYDGTSTEHNPCLVWILKTALQLHRTLTH